LHVVGLVVGILYVEFIKTTSLVLFLRRNSQV